MQKGCRQPRRPGGWLSASSEERRGGESQAGAIRTNEETGGAKAGAWAVALKGGTTRTRRTGRPNRDCRGVAVGEMAGHHKIHQRRHLMHKIFNNTNFTPRRVSSDQPALLIYSPGHTTATDRQADC